MTIVEPAYRKWLLQKKKMSKRSAGDVISRCRRIERVLSVSLSREINKINGLDLLKVKLKKKSTKFLSPKTNKVYALAVLNRAAALFFEYSKVNGKFHGKGPLELGQEPI